MGILFVGDDVMDEDVMCVFGFGDLGVCVGLGESVVVLCVDFL